MEVSQMTFLTDQKYMGEVKESNSSLKEDILQDLLNIQQKLALNINTLRE